MGARITDTYVLSWLRTGVLYSGKSLLNLMFHIRMQVFNNEFSPVLFEFRHHLTLLDSSKTLKSRDFCP